MKIISTDFDEVKILVSEKFCDQRGFWKTVYSNNLFNDYGIVFDILEERIYTPVKNAFYGIHFQNNPFGQNKLVSLINGKGMDYIVDLRKNSRTFKKFIKIELNSDNNQMIYIPHGFGHGFIALSENVMMSYKIDQYHKQNYSKAISYKDPEINLDIIINEELISDQDKFAPFLENSDCNL